jgi:hypothetical protein
MFAHHMISTSYSESLFPCCSEKSIKNS